MAGHADIFYATNMEIYSYISAMRRLEVSDSGLHNASDQILWVEVDGEVVRLAPGEAYSI